jgi:hypothetical protein
MRTVPVLTLLLAAACGPDLAQITRAHDAHYQGDPSAMFQAAEEAATGEHYKIDEDDADQRAFVTVNRMYGPEGDLESQGSGGFTQMRDRSIVLQFTVRIVPAEQAFAVEIEPHIQRAFVDRPNTDQLAPDDPSVPGWVHGRTDELAVAIHDALAAYEVRTP